MANGIGTLTPGYGRDYKSKAEVQAAFDADKDFINNYMGAAQLVNRQDLLQMGVKSVQVRYKQNRNVAVLKVK